MFECLRNTASFEPCPNLINNNKVQFGLDFVIEKHFFPTQNIMYNHGKCGVCGDPWQSERENEAGGRFASGIITRKYSSGQMINVDVEITANHLGWFEFRLCPVNNPTIRASDSCLDKHLLDIVGHGTR